MLRVNSQVLRNNHHSLHQKQSPYSLHSSKTESQAAKPRKMSTASTKENMPDLQKLIMDIKISPNPDPKLSTLHNIQKLLNQFQSNPLVADQVHAVHLLLQSIENKLSTRARPRAPLRRPSSPLSQISPIKQIQDTSSHILYTNLSIKDIEKSISLESSLAQSNKKTEVVSKFEDCQANEEMGRLNQEIKYLERLLERKSGGSGVGWGKKKDGKLGRA